ncbi:MAG: hypothetical protein DHS20C16_28230 [Phycisphaerae bacterium]|nr:MAG: hypothetical protein DHS20C16_28230 [Phycisphaerae bacterium]
MRTQCTVFSVLALGISSAIGAPIERASDDSGTIFKGAIADRDWGRPVASGDLDGDGWDEVIVAASEDFGDVMSHVYVMRGGPGAAQQGTIDLMLGGVDLTIDGAALNDNLGSSIAVGDVNGDTFNDLLICASGADASGRQRAGVAYLLYGGPTFFASATRDMSQTSDWDVKIEGPVAGGDMGGSLFFGGGDSEAAAIGKLNADAFGDMVLGVHLANGAASGAGRVYMILGKNFASGTTLSLLNGAHFDTLIYGKGSLDELGEMVKTGDLTGDGLDELIIPNRNYSQATLAAEGAVLIIRGRAVWPFSINLGTTAADITLLGVNSFDNLGEDAALGDFNGDGILDLASSAPGVNPGPPDNNINDGVIYGLFGANALQVGTITVDYASATPDFLIRGESNESMGAQIAAGDFNGDGYDDIAAGQRFGGPQTNGTIDIVFGRDFSANQTFDVNVDTDVRIVGAASDRIGFSMSVADVNGSGTDEVVFGTPFNNGSFPNIAGTAYVFSIIDGDYNADGVVDLFDFAVYQECASTPSIAVPPADACYVFDFLADQNVDAGDMEGFAAQLGGP